MTPLINRLQKMFPELPFLQVEHNSLQWAFTNRLQELGPDFYNKVVPLHVVLNLEYSFLGQQIRTNLLNKENNNREQVIRQLTAALMLAELLEHLYQHYLIAPREVDRLQKQQQLYREILAQLQVSVPSKRTTPILVDSSFSQQVRNTTLNTNLYRLLFTRSKRALDLIAAMDLGFESYHHLVRIIDKYTDPVLPYIAWIFFLPRLFVNLFLLIKHTLPGPWMDAKEKSLDWSVRFHAQMQRRWFELANDLVWASAGAINCFILVGALAPFSLYLSVACFAFDVVMAVTRAYIELRRLDELKTQYKDMLKAAANNVANNAAKKEILEHIAAIDKQIVFENIRFMSPIMTTSVLLLSMCATFALNPIIPAIGAILMVAICFVNFALVHILNHYRPKDTLDAFSGIANLGFFAKGEAKPMLLPKNKEEIELEAPNFCCC